MAFLPAGFVDGASTPGEMLRRISFAATAGDTGVVQAGDLRVTATGGTAVYIQAGSGFVATRFSDAYRAQSYVIANDSAVAVDVPANTGGSTITWYVIVRVTDPQYAGEPTPVDPLTDDYCVAELVTSLPSTKPYILLASVSMPAGASTVTQAQVTDRREMANPRRKRDLRAYPLRSADGTDKMNATGTDGEVWPNDGSFTVEVPSWAVKMRFIATWSQVNIPSTTAAYGRLWLRVASGRADEADTDYTVFNTISKVDSYRDTLTCLGEVTIPSTMRGASVVMQMRARLTSGDPDVNVDSASAISLDMEFVEAPTQDVV